MLTTEMLFALQSKRYRDKIIATCDICKKEFQTTKSSLLSHMKHNSTYLCCSKQCANEAIKKHAGPIIFTTCSYCNKPIQRRKCETTKSHNLFCSSKCSAKYNNTHKINGTTRSKLEKWIELQLTERYPNMIIQYNNKSAINSELDIYFPTLHLAFELNGIFHYEPIFGQDKLKAIQNNDSRKIQACLEHNIELCIIDSSGSKKLKPERDSKYIDIISKIVDLKLAEA